MTPSYLEKDVDDAAIAEEADKEEDDVGDGGNMPYHWMLKGHTNIYLNRLSDEKRQLVYKDNRKIFFKFLNIWQTLFYLGWELAPVGIEDGHEVGRQSIIV